MRGRAFPSRFANISSLKIFLMMPKITSSLVNSVNVGGRDLEHGDMGDAAHTSSFFSAKPVPAIADSSWSSSLWSLTFVPASISSAVLTRSLLSIAVAIASTFVA